jgi:fatty-acyl-CoA synthase
MRGEELPLAGPSEAPAFIDAATGTTTSYAAFRERIDRLAAALDARGVAVGDRVAALAYNAREIFELLYACGRIGAMLVPLNWRLSSRELEVIVRDAAPALLAVGRGLEEEGAALAAACGVKRDLDFGAETSAYERAIADASPFAGGAHDRDRAAVVLYTSGTTGTPKGAMLSWRQIAFNAEATIGACELDERDRCLGFLPLFHTGGLHCLATPLLRRGGAVVLMESFDASAAVRAIADHHITAAIAVPTVYEMLADAGLDRETAASLRVLLVGGAPCPPRLFERFDRLGCTLRQGYGLTEVGPNCFTFTPDDPARRHAVGRPMPGTEARLWTDEGREAAPGEPGELQLRGPHVTLGYLNKPELTAEALDAGGWFRTGDLASRDEAGDYVIVGRKKEMFISGGENVYPAEVERALAEHPGVAEVCVVGVPDARWGEVGMAVLVPRAGVDLEAEALRRFARARLAGYKVPRRWEVVRELPRTTTGKIARAAVRALADRA